MWRHFYGEHIVSEHFVNILRICFPIMFLQCAYSVNRVFSRSHFYFRVSVLHFLPKSLLSPPIMAMRAKLTAVGECRAAK